MAPILSPWLPIGSALAEVLKAAGTEILKAAGTEIGKTGIHEFLRTRKSNSKERLLELRNHFRALKAATDELVKETVAGVLTESYHSAREQWLSLFAPMETVLHHFDPRTMGIIEIYSPGLARLFQIELKVTAQNLADALADEEREFHYAGEGYLCTLCLQIVRRWSVSQTITGGLEELSVELATTVELMDHFIKDTWTVKEILA